MMNTSIIIYQDEFENVFASFKDFSLLDEGREWYELDPQNGEKMCLKMLEDISRSPTSSGGECFLAEKN